MLEGKDTAYEEDIRVPLAIRGPGIPKGRKVSSMVLNIELAPTFAAWASIESYTGLASPASVVAARP